MKFFGDFWSKLTSDSFILECINGVKIEFDSDPIQYRAPNEIKCNISERLLIDLEVHSYLKKGIVSKVDHCSGEFFSQNFFTA